MKNQGGVAWQTLTVQKLFIPAAIAVNNSIKFSIEV